jgi:glycosyltransferase involved in cell wall biosynthesis
VTWRGSEVKGLSVCVITQNERFEPLRFLANVSPVASEIVVVDGGAADDRCEVLGRHPAVRVVRRPFDDFTSQKNFAISQARGTWILMLDSDELLSDPLRNALPHLMRRWFVQFWKIRRVWLVSLDPPRYVAGRLFDHDFEIRLFRNRPNFRYPPERTVHQIFDRSTRGRGAKYRGGSILHLDFVFNDREARQAKVARYAAMDPESHAQGMNRSYLFEDGPHAILPLGEPCEALAL